MAGYQRTIISGEPGETWTNTTGKVQYQFIPTFHNTCGVCLQYAYKVGSWWPIPLHHGCRCIQRIVKPGDDAPEPFADFRKILEDFPRDQKAAAIGISNYKLLRAGLAQWNDIVTPSRVRDLREVVARNRLSTTQLVNAGVSPRIAEKAYAAIHTPEHEFIAKQRQELIDRLSRAGLAQEALSKELASRLAARVGIAAQAEAGIAAQRLPGVGAAQAAELKRLLQAAVITRVAMKPSPKQEREIHDAWIELIKDPQYAGLTLEEFKRLLAEDPDLRAKLLKRRRK